MSEGQNVDPANPTWVPRVRETPDASGSQAGATRTSQPRWSRRRGVLSVFAAFAAFGFVAAYAVEPTGAALAQSAPPAEASTLYSAAVEAPQSVQILAAEADAPAAGLDRDGYTVALIPKPVVVPKVSGPGWRPPFVVPNPGSAQAIAYQMVMARGWGDDQFACLTALWNKESGWRVNAHNVGSGAYGIPQALPGSKMATAGADWATNPATQISWGLSYITSRYGNPCGAWDKSQRSGWY